jgi:nucleotide-binding universal stress UspA family protein
MEWVLQAYGDAVKVSVLVLPRGSKSIREAADTLLEHAENRAVDLIALTTHAKKKREGSFVGSFADSLILRAKRPLLISNPDVQEEEGPAHVVFATDLSPVTESAFQLVLVVAKQLEAKLTLFHAFEPTQGILSPPGFMAEPSSEKRQSDVRTRIEKLKACAIRSGVETSSEIALAAHGISEAIVKQANKSRATLIALEARHDKLLPSYIGVTAREVIRNASCRVLTIPAGVPDAGQAGAFW